MWKGSVDFTLRITYNLIASIIPEWKRNGAIVFMVLNDLFLAFIGLNGLREREIELNVRQPRQLGKKK